MGCPESGPWLSARSHSGDLFGQTKITDARLAGPIDQDVAWFDVPVMTPFS